MTTEKTEQVKVFALGGVGEIGKNMYVVEVNDNIFVVDAGLMYPEDEMLGIDIVIPDHSYLLDNKDRVKAIFLTHGHEDHVGGLGYVLRNLKVPVYATKFTLSLVEDRLKEQGVTDVQLREIHPDSIVTIERLNISFFRVNHSIPDAVGVCFHTPNGAVVYTGDFKFDQNPAPFYQADIGKMANIGHKGVLCLLSDSTNAEKPGYNISEAQVKQEIGDSVYNAQGRVIAAIYATNVNRIQQIIDAARAVNRKIVLVGKHMLRVVEIATKQNYLQIDKEWIVPVNQASQLPDSELLYLTTGSTGEPFQALARMAKQNHKQINVRKGDTVLIAATPVPGNELNVAKTVDALYRAGANVIFGQKKIHVSGHGTQEELKLMLNLMKPKYFIPVHGEYKMQVSHRKVAESIGIDRSDIFVVEKGEVVEFKNGVAQPGGRVTSGNVLIDGLGVGDVGNIVLRDRRLLSQDGIMIVVVTLSKEKKQIIAGPEIISRGFVYVRESETLFEESTKMVTDIVNRNMSEYMIEWSAIKSNIREALNQFLFEKTKRKPMILPIIMEI